jgi:hypothetical protein
LALSVMSDGEEIVPVRRTHRFGQPVSMVALRPSQRRAATSRAARREQRSVGYWLRRLRRA